MKSIIIAAVLFAGAVWAADEAADRAMIENTVRVFSMAPTRAGLFTSDFDDQESVRFRRAVSPDSGAIPIAVEGVPGEVVISKEPMGEATWFPAGMGRNLGVRKIRFVTADVAMVDAGSKVPVLMVMRKVLTEWKIASVRVLAEN